MRYDSCVYVRGGGNVFRYTGGVSIEGLVGRPDLSVELRGASRIGDFTGIAGVTRGEFSMEACGFGCEVAGI